MKKCYFFSAVIALTFAGCTQEPFSREDGTEITVEAIMADNPASRTVIQEGTTSVLWEAGDEINVFYDGTGSRFANLYTDPSGTAKFSGTLNVVFASNEGFSDSTPLWGLYPYRADATADNTSVTTTLPASQTGRAGSFAKGTNITLGKSSSLTMGFYNVCGGVRFSLTQEGVKEVVFEGQNDESIAGKVKLVFADGVPAVQEVLEGQKTITLTAPNGGTFETGKWYYIVALPGTLTGGFKMTFNTNTQYATLKSSGTKTIKRGIFGSLADADEDLIYKDKGGDEPPVTGSIVFADPAAKYACVAKYDTNGDGEVSIEEAEAATSFGSLFDNWKGVVSFDEIHYFKNVHSLSGVFSGCSKLVSITIPENITDLGTYAFSGCTSLTSIVLPSGITVIGNYTFQNCTALSSIDIPSNVASIGRYAFHGCSSLSSVILPSSITTIENYTFQNCSSLETVDIPSNVIAIGQSAFSGCSMLGSIDLPAGLKTIGQSAFNACGLTQIVVPDGVTSLGNSVFSGCSQLTTATIPSAIGSIPAYCFQNCASLASVFIAEGVTSIGNQAFSGVHMWKLGLPSSISSLGNTCFGSIVCVILPSTSPITIQSDTFDGVVGIFVPSNLIDMYHVMTNWANYSLRIHPLDTYKEKNAFTLATSGAVDMGTSVKWAAYNLGASKPEENGDYYAWGETQTKSNYDWSTYKWCNGDYNKQTKYCPADKTDYWDGEETPDGKTVLDLEDDAAHVNLGGAWRMPTDEEWTELRVNCPWEWTVYEGINGYMVYGFDSGNSMFLPAAGYRYSTNLFNAGSDGYYWSSSLFTFNPLYAWYVYFYSGIVYGDYYGSYRYYGRSVRPVTE